MTTTDYLAAPVADKHLAWITNVLTKTKFSQDYLAADISVKYERVKGEKLDTFVEFKLANGTVTRLATGSGLGNLNGTQTKWAETRKAFAALVAPAAEPVKEEPVAEAAAPKKPKAKKTAKSAKASVKTAPAADKTIAEVEAVLEMADPAEVPAEL